MREGAGGRVQGLERQREVAEESGGESAIWRVCARRSRVSQPGVLQATSCPVRAAGVP